MAAEPTEMSNEPEHAPFDPKPFLKTIRTKNGMQQYLPTAPRVAWLRNDHPDAQIVTEALRMDEKGAAFKCTITIPSTGAVATGHGTETPGDFGDFIEKAETKAVGRACVTLGYGTLQAGNDFDEIDRTVDAPQDVPTTRPARAQGRPEPTPIRPSPITEENDLHGHDVKWAKVFEIIDFSYLQDPAKTGTDLAEAIRGLSRANGLSAYGFHNYVCHS